jgi:hypothetical protein
MDTNYTEAGKAIGFALEQSFRVAALAVFRFMDFKTASAYLFRVQFVKIRGQKIISRTRNRNIAARLFKK